MVKNNKQDSYVRMTQEDWQRKGYSWPERIICSNVLGYVRNGRPFFASARGIAEKFGISVKLVYKTFSKMKKDGIFPETAVGTKKRGRADSQDGESHLPGVENNSTMGDNDSLGVETHSPYGVIKSGEMPLKTGSLYASRYPSLNISLEASRICQPEPASEAAQANAAAGAEVKETDAAEMAKITAKANSVSTAAEINAKESVSAFDKLVAVFAAGKAAPTNTLSSTQANAASSDKRSQGSTNPLPSAQNVTTSKQTPKATVLGDNDDGYFTASTLNGKIVRFPKGRTADGRGTPVSATLSVAVPQLPIKKTLAEWDAEFRDVFADELKPCV